MWWARRAKCAPLPTLRIYSAACSCRRVMSPRPAINPAIEISSSNSSQCNPVRLISTFARCAGEALSRRGNQASGTPNVRPSVRSTHIVCSSKRTSVAEMLMPCSQDQVASVVHNAQNTREFGRIEAIAVCDGYLGLQPDFGVLARAFHVYVQRFTRKAFIGVEEEPQPAISKDERHAACP